MDSLHKKQGKSQCMLLDHKSTYCNRGKFNRSSKINLLNIKSIEFKLIYYKKNMRDGSRHICAYDMCIKAMTFTEITIHVMD